MTYRVSLIGYPIRHSVSPVFQQAALDHLGLDAAYQAWEIEPGSLAGFVDGLRSPDTWGANVTVPHKEAVMPHLDRVDEWARNAGAVNTIVNEDGKLAGFNTDGVGFLRALEEHAHFTPKGRAAVIIGAGGSARAVALALAGAGAASIAIANRTLERAERLSELVRNHCPVVRAVPLDDGGEALVAAVAKADLLVNCTTLGMLHGPDEGGTPVHGRHIPARLLVYDLVYNPLETPLLCEARKAGAATLGGLPMLVYQGAASFQLWTGREAPVSVMLEAATEAMR